MINAVLDLGFSFITLIDGGSDANAIAANVSIIRFTHSIWVTVSGDLIPGMKAPTSTIRHAATFTVIWNMFNAKAFETNKSALHFKNSKGFVTIAALILFGQILIVTLGGAMFNVTPINITDWLIIIGVTSIVLWIGELVRMIKK